MGIAVRCENLTKIYDTSEQKVVALNSVNLKINLGELMMLVGPSGCGKTTLISVIAGILDQNSGLCELFGENLLTMKSKDKLQFRATQIGFVFQAFNLLPSLNAAENVSVPLIINGVKRDTAKQQAIEVLERVGLGERWKSYPNQLSGGQQQRVAIARALVNDPEIIFADEPTGNLDSKSGLQVMKILQHLNDRRAPPFTEPATNTRINKSIVTA